MTPASTVLVLRDGDGGLEVLMGRRRVDLAFGGAWVFPGGALEDIDHDETLTLATGLEDGAWRAAAVRETAEEVGIYLTLRPVPGGGGLRGADVYRHVVGQGTRFDYEGLGYLSNWVTPVGVSRRFDTRFFAAVVDSGTELGRLAEEFEVAQWIRPGAALAEHRAGTRMMILPTLAHLDFLNEFGAASDALGAASGDVRRIEPRLVRREGRIEAEVPSQGPGP